MALKQVILACCCMLTLAASAQKNIRLFNGKDLSGWQVEVAPPDKHTGGIYESYGRGWLIQPKKEDEQWLKAGEWNTLKIVANGNKVTTWLNGHQMVQIDDEKIGTGRGFIALQIHDGGGIKVRWKELKIKKLPD